MFATTQTSATPGPLTPDARATKRRSNVSSREEWADCASGIRSLLEQYPWLKSENEHKQAAAIQYLVSVEQAQSLAETFRRADDRLSAAQALRTITKERLPGSCNDFHNAFSEAMKLNDPTLALGIVALGLDMYPDQYDLVADRTHVLARLGRAAEAKDLFEDWRYRKPGELVRSWRPVVFYEDLFESLELSEEAIQSLVQLTFYLNSSLKQVHCIDGSAAHVAVAAVGPLGVVVHQPSVQVGL